LAQAWLGITESNALPLNEHSRNVVLSQVTHHLVYAKVQAQVALSGLSHLSCGPSDNLSGRLQAGGMARDDVGNEGRYGLLLRMAQEGWPLDVVRLEAIRDGRLPEGNPQ
jgi:hypothetical protein